MGVTIDDLRKKVSIVGTEQLEVDTDGISEKVTADDIADYTIQKVKSNIGDIGVKPDGSYPKMSVGFADNLVGRGEATAEEFTYRPTNGFDPIEDDVARITKVKGNSVVWNQLFTPKVGTFTIQGLTIIIDETGKVNVTGTSTSASGIAIGRAQIVSGRKYIFTGIPKSDNISHWWGDQTSQIDYGEGVITTPTYPDENRYMCIYVREGETVDITFYPKVCDLTKAFGAGNEPTTVEEFYARIPSGIDIDAYNEGEIINLNTEAIKTVGFNQWDEQWELGYLTSDGSTSGYVQNYIRAKNYIPVIAGAKYYAKLPNGTSDEQLYVVDKNFNLVKQFAGTWINTEFVIPDGASYMRFYLNYGSETYKNDICINLSHTGWKNGTYEPYREFTRELPVIKKYFSDGMKKAGNVCDSIEWDSSKQKWVAVQRIGEVDMGTLAFTRHLVEDRYHFTALIPYIKNATSETYTSNILQSRYSFDTTTGVASQNNNSIRRYANAIYIRDDAYTNVDSFKTAMSGVMLNYELAEPIVTEIEDKNINFDYDAEDFGTEEALSSVPSAPFSADIIYKFNAVDSIRQNRLDIKALQELVATLQSQVASMQIK